MRATPRDWKQAHGSIGRMQQTLFGQVGTLRLQLQDCLGIEITSNDCIFPWIVKHSQFLLNRYMTHEDGQTSIFEDGKRTIKLDCVNLVKLFCFECRVNCVTKLTLPGMKASG